MTVVTAGATKHVILFLAASPGGTSGRALDREAKAIHAELKRSGYRDRFQFVTRWAVEPLDLLRELRELRPTVVHFSGRVGAGTARASRSARGTMAPASAARADPHGIYFQAASGSAQLVSPAAIAQAFRAAGTSVKLVVLSACYTTPTADVLLEHVDCVVGVSGSDHGDAARSFAIGFYGGLGEHASVAAAFEHGKAAIHLEGRPDAEQPRLRTRTGRDAAQLILAAVTPSLRVDVPCPYPGMRPFAPDDAADFYGRDAEIQELVGKLRAGAREIYVIGPSGSGKSSLVAAGVLPRLARGVTGLGPFLVRDLRPGEQPATRLFALLEVAPGQPLVAADRIAALLAHRSSEASLLLVVDQLEELFTQASPAERQQFLAALRDLRAERRFVVVFTMRADFFGALMESELWTQQEGLLPRIEVAHLRGKPLRDAISEPAAAVGVVVEQALIERLLADTASEPGILPLLQETMVQLWDERADRTLTLADYQALGDGNRSGLAVALSRRGDNALHALTGQQQRIARRIVLRLISFGEGREDTRRQQPCSTLRAVDDDAADFEHVLQHLAAERLLVIDNSNENKRAFVDLAHEIMISAWPTLAGWLQEYRAGERQRRELEAAAARWLAHGCSTRGLLNPIELAEVEVWRRTQSARDLGDSPAMIGLLLASKQALRHQRWRRRSITSTAFIMLVAFAVFTCHQGNDNERLLAQSYADAGRELMVEGRPQEAIPYFVAARRHGEASASVRMMFWNASHYLPVVLEHDATVQSVEFTPDSMQVITISDDNRLHLWDAGTGRPVVQPRSFGESRIHPTASPDGMNVITAIGDTSFRIWNVTTGIPLTHPLAHDKRVTGTAFSDDGLQVATISEDGAAQIWDTTSGEPLTAPFGPPLRVQTATFSPDGTRVVTICADTSARVWDTDTGQLVASFLDHTNDILSATFSPDSAYIVTASSDHTAQIWSATAGVRTAPALGHQKRVRSAAFSSDGTRVVTASDDATAQIWDARTGGRVLHPLAHDGAVVGAAFGPDGSLIVTASSDHAARIWDARTGEPVGPPLWHDGPVSTAAFSPDGTRIVTMSGDHAARIWKVPRFVARIEHHGAVWSAAMSPDGTRVVTASADHTARIWDAVTAKPVTGPLQHKDVVRSAAFSPDGTRVVTASADKTAQIWDVETGKSITRPLVHGAIVKSAVFSPDGTRIVTASQDGARVWQAGTGTLLSVHKDDSGDISHHEVWSVAFNPDGTRVVSASALEPAVVWDALTGTTLTVFSLHASDVVSAAFSPDGTRVVTASRDQTARIWDSATGAPIGRPLEHKDVVWSAVFSPDGERVLTASKDKTACIWDAKTGELITSILEHQELRTAMFSPDGERVLTVSEDDATRIWDATTGKPITAAVGRRSVRAAAFSPDGTRIVTANTTNTASILDARLDGGTMDDWAHIAERVPFELREGARVFLDLRRSRDKP